MLKKSLSTAIAAGALLLAAQTASAAPVLLGVDDSLVTVDDRVGEARYRLSQTNWDQMLSNGANPITAPDITTNGLGNATALNHTSWDFTITYESGDDGVQGFTFAMNQVGGTGSGTLVYDLNNPLNGLTPDGDFNAIKIELRAGALRDRSAYTESAYIDLTNLTFTSSRPNSGALDDPMSAFTPPTTEENNVTWITATNGEFLSDIDWTLSGNVTAGFDCDGAGATNCLRDESLKMNFKFADATVVPIPAAAWLLGSGLGMLAFMRRR